MSEVQSTVEYREIKGFPGYRVGSDGTMWFCWKWLWQRKRVIGTEWKPMKLSPGFKGYLRVNLVPPGGGTYKTFRVHRLVCEAFKGPCPEGMECRHLNGINTDNRAENLEWGTHGENMQDAVKHGGFSNRPHNLRFTHNGETLHLKEWARKLNVNYNVLWARIRKLNMSFDEAISRPFLGVKGNGDNWRKEKLFSARLQGPS